MTHPDQPGKTVEVPGEGVVTGTLLELGKRVSDFCVGPVREELPVADEAADDFLNKVAYYETQKTAWLEVLLSQMLEKDEARGEIEIVSDIIKSRINGNKAHQGIPYALPSLEEIK